MKFNPQPKPVKKEKSKYDLRKAMQLKTKNKKLVAKIKTTKQTIGKLKFKLDAIFNEFIRLRDVGKRCISCGKFTALQAGHYHSCRYLSIRWDERNVNGQCVNCNIFNQGNFFGYSGGIKKLYGENVIQILDIKKNNIWKPTQFELSLLIQEYETKVNYLKSIK